MALVRCSTDPPLCICGCEQPVKRKAKSDPEYVRGPRIIDGISWRWFAGRACSGRVQGNANIQAGLAARADGHRAWVSRRRKESWSDEIALLRRYHVPQGLAEGVLASVYRRGQNAVYQRLLTRREAIRQRREKASA